MSDKEFSMIQDLPIKKSSEDLLNRKSFANDLGKVLLKHFENFSEYSFSIGLYGKWGSGKTSLLNMVLESVKEQSENQDHKPIIVEFNPWLCSDRQQMISQFFKQLVSEIQNLGSQKLEVVWKAIAKYGDLLDFTSSVPAIGSILAILGKVATSYAKSETAKIESNLKQQKDSIVQALTDQSLKDDLKIIVTIDDIDRLTKEEIVAVFQLVKNLADFPNTVYLLAFDYDIVTKALEDVQYNYGEDGAGKEYLEKIIQVPFQIPAPNMTAIHHVFVEKIEKIIGKPPYEGESINAWRELFQFGIKPCIQSMRDVNRFANVFYLKYLFLSNETNVFDLIGLTCLQVFEPNIYSELPAMKSVLCGTSVHTHDKSEYVKKEVENFIKDVAADNQESIRCILGFLFPIVSDALTFNIKISINLNGATRYNKKDLLLNRKIAAEACFDRYFSLTLEADAIPSSLIEQMIMDMSREELIQHLNDLEKNGKINRFIDELNARVASYKTSLPEERAALLIEIIMQQWDFLIRNTTKDSIYRLPEMLLKELKNTSRFEFLSKLFENSETNLSALDNLLDILSEPHTPLGDKDRQLISLDEIKSLENTFSARAIVKFNDWINGEHYDNLKYLYKLEKLKTDLNSKEKIKEKIAVSENNEALACIISHCTDVSLVSYLNNAKCWNFNFNSFKEFVFLEDADSRMKTYVQSADFFDLPEEIQMDVVNFLLLCKQPQPEKEAISEEQIMKELKRLEEERK